MFPQPNLLLSEKKSRKKSAKFRPFYKSVQRSYAVCPVLPSIQDRPQQGYSGYSPCSPPSKPLLAYQEKNGIAILTIEEQQLIFKRLSEESYKVFREKQTRLFGEILKNFGVRADKGNINLFTNLSLMVMIVRRAIPGTLPLLVPEAVEETVDFQINAIVDALEKRREVKNVKEAGGREQKKSVGKVKTKGEEERESKSKNGK